MQQIILDYYLWVKSLHLIAVISWMAGLLYLPRLYVYHADAAKGSELSETFKTMERRLLRGIMNPAMIATWVLGLCMLWANTGLLEGKWLHAKLGLVVLMTGFHHALSAWRKKFAGDANTSTAGFYRKINEVPTVIMICIVVLVLVKPF